MGRYVVWRFQTEGMETPGDLRRMQCIWKQQKKHNVSRGQGEEECQIRRET